MVKFKECFHKCIQEAEKMYPDCKKSLQSEPKESDWDMTWHDLCPLATWYCVDICHYKDADWNDWLYSLDHAIGQQQSSAVVTGVKSRH